MEDPRAPEILSELLKALREHMEKLPGGLEYAAVKAGFREVEDLERWFQKPLDEVPALELVAGWLLAWETLDRAEGTLHGFAESEVRRENAVPDEIAEISGKGPLQDFLFELLKRLALDGILSRDGVTADARLLAQTLAERDQ